VNRAVLFFVSALPLLSQSVQVYSEFARFGLAGEVTAPAQPREILSPAVVRNGFTSFQIVVRVPKNTPYALYVGENPPHASKVSVYRETADRLEPVDLPYQGDSTQVLWLDVWIDRDAPVRRIKIEPQMTVNLADNDLGWITYPMEVRIMDAQVPVANVEGDMQAFLCGSHAADPSSLSAAERFHLRNQQQDVALAARAQRPELERLFGACDAGPAENPEWYLRLRDYLFRMR
jgi:hypothetical protein